jgi:hypothetical protein
VTKTVLAAALAALTSAPALAHMSGPLPHWHAGDVGGVLAVFAITAVAAWIDRRWKARA